MSHKVRLQDIFENKRHQKTVLIVIVAVFLALEMLIYLTAAGHAGQKSRVVVSDANGGKIYETTGTALTSYEKMVFENTFGPLRDYYVHIQTESVPFPFRAWVSAAVGVPVSLVLLVAFLVRAYLSLLFGDEKESKEERASQSDKASRFGSVFHLFHRFSVFHIGFLLVIGVLLFWIVPNFLGDFAQISVTAIKEFKWFFLGMAIFLAFLITWIIYLRYRLSRKMLDNQLDLEKFRVEKQLLIQAESTPLLAGSVNEVQEHSLNQGL